MFYEGYISSTASSYGDYRRSNAQYYELSFAKSFSASLLNKEFQLRPNVTTGFASNSEDVYEDNGLVQITPGVESPFAVGAITLSPQLYYTLV